MRKLVTIFALLACPAALLAEAYNAKVPIIEDPVCTVPFYGSVSTGYEYVYLFRGVDFGKHAPWLGSISIMTSVRQSALMGSVVHQSYSKSCRLG